MVIYENTVAVMEYNVMVTYEVTVTSIIDTKLNFGTWPLH